MVDSKSLEWLIDNWRHRAQEHRATALAQRDAQEARGHAAFAAAYNNCAVDLDALLIPTRREPTEGGDV